MELKELKSLEDDTYHKHISRLLSHDIRKNDLSKLTIMFATTKEVTVRPFNIGFKAIENSKPIILRELVGPKHHKQIFGST